jgi:hypothetical protein
MPKVIEQVVTDRFALYNADCVEVVAALPNDSVDLSVFSPPFASLYTYSASPRDMGNSIDGDEFAKHFRFLVADLLRVTKPGRLIAVHCMQLPTSKTRDGMIGIRDFRGELIRSFVEAGGIYHSEVCIWKDPVTAMQRTKSLGLLHKTIRTDSSMSRQGLPDYVVMIRKAGKNPDPIAHTGSDPLAKVETWQRYASPVWVTTGESDDEGFARCTADINPAETLQHRSAREDKDERHICPLQLEVIRRVVRLWSSPGDVVLSPFAGIGSEGYVALQEGRRFIGAELKVSYYQQAARNLHEAATPRTADLFSRIA